MEVALKMSVTCGGPYVSPRILWRTERRDYTWWSLRISQDIMKNRTPWLHVVVLTCLPGYYEETERRDWIVFSIWELNRPLSKPFGLVQEMAHDPANKVHSMLVLVSHLHCVQEFDHFIAIQLGTV